MPRAGSRAARAWHDGSIGGALGRRERGASKAQGRHGRGTVAALAGCRGSGSGVRGPHRRGTRMPGVLHGGAAGGARRRRWLHTGQLWR